MGPTPSNSNYYHLTEHGCDIRNRCESKDHFHVIRPDSYNKERFPGNWLGLVVRCEGLLNESCAYAVGFCI